jgi:alpha-tubulin suppressor-like RCC1 family protein
MNAQLLNRAQGADLWRRLGRNCGCFHLNLTASSALRYFAVYAVGEGWTGALTRENILKTIPGHFDDDEPDEGSSLSDPYTSFRPVMIYPHNDIKQAVAGWGNTALLDVQGVLRVVGKPHDVVSLLRMNRMPRFVQRWISRQQLHSVEAVTPVGSAISNLIGWATGTDEQFQGSWGIAKKYSFLPNWTKVDITNNLTNNDSRIKYVDCGPGFMAMIGEGGGTLYTMGVNNRGQCGNGTISNNVWTPEPVRGLSMSSAPTAEGDNKTIPLTEQEHPIIQVALGFQHGYALSKEGQVYTWGKGQRGQLGREMDFDQDPWAAPIVFDQRVVQVGAGHHHGALLTENHEVYIWGKSMGRKSSLVKDESLSSSRSNITDAKKPEKVMGLPRAPNGVPVKVHRISCGSHHTAILLEDGSIFAVGIASDQAVSILDPVEIVPAGLLELPVRQFEAHHDRTTVIDRQGNVFQAHLWKSALLRQFAYFTPPYVDVLLDEGKSIRSIHRGWRHTIIVTF